MWAAVPPAVRLRRPLPCSHPRATRTTTCDAPQLDEYQEQPLLLDRSLEASLDILMGCLRGMILGGARSDADELVAGLAGPDDSAAAFPFQVHHHPTMKFVFKVRLPQCTCGVTAVLWRDRRLTLQRRTMHPRVCCGGGLRLCTSCARPAATSTL